MKTQQEKSSWNDTLKFIAQIGFAVVGFVLMALLVGMLFTLLPGVAAIAAGQRNKIKNRETDLERIDSNTIKIDLGKIDLQEFLVEAAVLEYGRSVKKDIESKSNLFFSPSASEEKAKKNFEDCRRIASQRSFKQADFGAQSPHLASPLFMEKEVSRLLTNIWRPIPQLNSQRYDSVNKLIQLLVAKPELLTPGQVKGIFANCGYPVIAAIVDLIHNTALSGKLENTEAVIKGLEPILLEMTKFQEHIAALSPQQLDNIVETLFWRVAAIEEINKQSFITGIRPSEDVVNLMHNIERWYKASTDRVSSGHTTFICLVKTHMSGEANVREIQDLFLYGSLESFFYDGKTKPLVAMVDALYEQRYKKSNPSLSKSNAEIYVNLFKEAIKVVERDSAAKKLLIGYMDILESIHHRAIQISDARSVADRVKATAELKKQMDKLENLAESESHQGIILAVRMARLMARTILYDPHSDSILGLYLAMIPAIGLYATSEELGVIPYIVAAAVAIFSAIHFFIMRKYNQQFALVDKILHEEKANSALCKVILQIMQSSSLAQAEYKYCNSDKKASAFNIVFTAKKSKLWSLMSVEDANGLLTLLCSRAMGIPVQGKGLKVTAHFVDKQTFSVSIQAIHFSGLLGIFNYALSRGLYALPSIGLEQDGLHLDVSFAQDRAILLYINQAIYKLLTSEKNAQYWQLNPDSLVIAVHTDAWRLNYQLDQNTIEAVLAMLLETPIEQQNIPTFYYQIFQKKGMDYIEKMQNRLRIDCAKLQNLNNWVHFYLQGNIDCKIIDHKVIISWNVQDILPNKQLEAQSLIHFMLYELTTSLGIKSNFVSLNKANGLFEIIIEYSAMPLLRDKAKKEQRKLYQYEGVEQLLNLFKFQPGLNHTYLQFESGQLNLIIECNPAMLENLVGYLKKQCRLVDKDLIIVANRITLEKLPSKESMEQLPFREYIQQEEDARQKQHAIQEKLACLNACIPVNTELLEWTFVDGFFILTIKPDDKTTLSNSGFFQDDISAFVQYNLMQVVGLHENAEINPIVIENRARQFIIRLDESVVPNVLPIPVPFSGKHLVGLNKLRNFYPGAEWGLGIDNDELLVYIIVGSAVEFDEKVLSAQDYLAKIAKALSLEIEGENITSVSIDAVYLLKEAHIIQESADLVKQNIERRKEKEKPEEKAKVKEKVKTRRKPKETGQVVFFKPKEEGNPTRYARKQNFSVARPDLQNLQEEQKKQILSALENIQSTLKLWSIEKERDLVKAEKRSLELYTSLSDLLEILKQCSRRLLKTDGLIIDWLKIRPNDDGREGITKLRDMVVHLMNVPDRGQFIAGIAYDLINQWGSNVPFVDFMGICHNAQKDPLFSRLDKQECANQIQKGIETLKGFFKEHEQLPGSSVEDKMQSFEKWIVTHTLVVRAAIDQTIECFNILNKDNAQDAKIKLGMPLYSLLIEAKALRNQSSHDPDGHHTQSASFAKEMASFIVKLKQLGPQTQEVPISMFFRAAPVEASSGPSSRPYSSHARK